MQAPSPLPQQPLPSSLFPSLSPLSSQLMPPSESLSATPLPRSATPDEDIEKQQLEHQLLQRYGEFQEQQKTTNYKKYIRTRIALLHAPRGERTTTEGRPNETAGQTVNSDDMAIARSLLELSQKSSSPSTTASSPCSSSAPFLRSTASPRVSAVPSSMFSSSLSRTTKIPVSPPYSNASISNPATTRRCPLSMPKLVVSDTTVPAFPIAASTPGLVSPRTLLSLFRNYRPRVDDQATAITAGAAAAAAAFACNHRAAATHNKNNNGSRISANMKRSSDSIPNKPKSKDTNVNKINNTICHHPGTFISPSTSSSSYPAARTTTNMILNKNPIRSSSSSSSTIVTTKKKRKILTTERHSSILLPYCSTKTTKQKKKSSIDKIQKKMVSGNPRFTWANYPELKRFLMEHREEFLTYSSNQNYTTEQRDYNNRLTTRFLCHAKTTTPDYYDVVWKRMAFTEVRNKIRSYYKSYVQSKKRKHQMRVRARSSNTHQHSNKNQN